MITKDIYQAVTDNIIAMLEQGVRPWRKPWNAEHAAGRINRPLRADGKTPYRGINVLLLWIAAEAKGYSAPIWMTYRQAGELGGQVRKGERGTPVTFADKIKKDAGTDDEREIFCMRQYSVFNVEQIDGLPERFHGIQNVRPLSQMERIEAAEQFFSAIPARIEHGGNRAFYNQTDHFVQMPPFLAFKDAESYYATLSHELTHWTKAPVCLNRDFGRVRFADEGYAKEELVAELGAAFIAADLGLEAQPSADHADYLASWLRVLKEDKRAIFSAASHAEKAAAFLTRFVNQAAEMERQMREAG